MRCMHAYTDTDNTFVSVRSCAIDGRAPHMVRNRRTGEYLFGMFLTINVVRTSSPRKTASTSITVGSRGAFLGGDDVGVLVLAVEARWMAGDGGVCEVKLRKPDTRSFTD